MSASEQAAELSASARRLSECLWKVGGRSDAVDWMAQADTLLMQCARLLDRSEVRAALGKVNEGAV